MDKDFLALLNLSDRDLSSQVDFEKYLTEAGVDKKNRLMALNVYKNKRQRKSQISVVRKFIELTNLELPKTMTPKKYQELYSYLRFVEKLDVENPIKHFIELAVALRTDNKQWVRKVSKKIINSSALQYAIFFEPRNMKGKLYLQFIDGIFDTLNILKNDFKDPMLLKMLVTRTLFFIPTKHKKKFNDEFSGNWSLNELREIVSTRKYGQDAIGLWFNVLENRTTATEVNKFLDDTLRKSALKKLPREEFWILRYFYPGGERREVLEKRIALFVKDKRSIIDPLILNEILVKEPIQKKLEKIDSRYGRALFKVRREIYQEVLQSGYPSQFALYNLFLLGEKDPELFWWFVL